MQNSLSAPFFNVPQESKGLAKESEKNAAQEMAEAVREWCFIFFIVF